MCIRDSKRLARSETAHENPVAHPGKPAPQSPRQLAGKPVEAKKRQKIIGREEHLMLGKLLLLEGHLGPRLDHVRDKPGLAGNVGQNGHGIGVEDVGDNLVRV